MPPTTAGPGRSLRRGSPLMKPYSPRSKTSTPPAAAPMDPRGFMLSCVTMARRAGASGWRGSCVITASWVGASDGLGAPPSPIPMRPRPPWIWSSAAFVPDANEIDRLWCSDVTYIRTWEGWLYLATVIDVASRRVVGWAMADHMRTELVCDALRMAIHHRRPAPGLILHSDRGSQYTSTVFGDLLDANGIRQSLSRPGQCWDNAVAESFFATLKTELVHMHAWPTRAQARNAIFEFMEVFYNRLRLHSALGYLSPENYQRRRARLDARTKAAA